MKISLIESIGLVLSVGSLIYSHIIYRKQSKTQTIMDDFLTNTLTMVKEYEQTSFDVLVHLRNENLRFLVNQLPNEKFWYFKWRFETWNNFTLGVVISSEVECAIHVKILGTTENFRKNTFEGTAYEYYICEVITSTNHDVFPLESRIVCFYSQREMHVSKFIGRLAEPEEKYIFSIVGLGDSQYGQGNDIPVEQVSYNPRAKDFTL